MMKKALSVAIASSLIAASAISFAAETTDGQVPAIQAAPAVVINPASPATYMGFMNPATHKGYHDAVANPAQWGQFMQPQFYMQMANPAVMAQWMNPASYQVMMNPGTYMAWMQPATVMNEMGSFPFTMMNPATMTGATAQMGDAAGQNWFDMSAWTNMFQPAAPASQATPEKDEG
jgi:hypothetical protein